MPNVTLVQVALFLAAGVVAAPLAKALRISNVLGYLFVGVLIGPYGLGFVYTLYEVDAVLRFGAFGVVLLLFLIGLELRPKRLWAMRSAILGTGGAQVALSGLALAALASSLSLSWQAAAFTGLALSLSSTAFALQLLEERGELALRHGRLAFAVLLFQDLVAIPLIALAPLFAAGAKHGAAMELLAAARALLIILAVIVAGHALLDPLFRLIARSRVKEAMTAAALLTVVGVTLIMDRAGLSASLGAFLAGLLLADSDYRHQIEADIAPFERLLLGLFFTAVGMSLDLALIAQHAFLVAGIVLALLATKSAILYVLGRRAGLEAPSARRFALAIAQGGEFAFVLFAVGAQQGVLAVPTAGLLTLAVALSMAATPLLLAAESVSFPPVVARRPFDRLPDNTGHVVVAGFGRVGQIIARILAAKRIPSPRSTPIPSTSTGCANSGRASSMAMRAGRKSSTRPRPARRAPSCWRSTTRQARCERLSWCVSAIPTCRSTLAHATAVTPTS